MTAVVVTRSEARETPLVRRLTEPAPQLVSAAMPTETEVRDVVQRVVDRLVPDRPAPQPAPSPQPTSGGIVAIGSDHGGFSLKERLVQKLGALGHEVIDCGTGSADPVDYPDFAHSVAQFVSIGEAKFGIVVDGAGIGSAMVANKVPGVRAALCYDISSARNSREHNHANVLTLGAGLVGPSLAEQIVETWLATPWGPGRHAERVGKITAIEHRYARSEP